MNLYGDSFGYKEFESPDWEKENVPRGKLGLKLRLADFKPEAVHPVIVAMADEILIPYNFKDILRISKSAAAFYVWTRNVIEIITADNGGKLPSLPRPIPPLPPGTRFPSTEEKEKYKRTAVRRADKLLLLQRVLFGFPLTQPERMDKETMQFLKIDKSKH